MGVKTTITPSQLPIKYQSYRLIPTLHGVMSSVYLLGHSYVLKLFEKETSLSQIDNEALLLNSIHNVPIAKLVDRFTIDGHPVLIYTQIQGESLTNPTIEEIEQIAIFLKIFHSQSQHLNSTNQQVFTKKHLKKLIDLTQNETLLDYFNTIEITLKNEGVIHGDLFLDNCVFQQGKLSGVYDFSDASLGDFHFELAVVVVDWCFEAKHLNETKVQTLLTHYGSNIKREIFQSYIKYALLYYATTRHIEGRDSHTLLQRLASIT